MSSQASPPEPMADASPVTYAIDHGVATVTMNRPRAMNALDHSARELLRDTLADAAHDPDVRAVVVTGAGRAFCVGQDLREHVTSLAEKSNADLWAIVPQHYAPIAHTIAAMRKPVIAAVNGVAAGAGASIALACDLRVFADSAGLNTAFVGIGLSCDTGISWTLPRIVGAGRAADLLLLPRTVGAEEALALGIANRVVPAAELGSATMELAHALAAGPTIAYASVKEAIAYGATHSFDEALAFEGELMARTGATEDHRNAVASFMAKEPPEFHAR